MTEALRRGRGVPVVPSRLANLLPSVPSSSSSSSSTSVPPAVPLSLVPILAVVDVAGSAIVPAAVTPLLVQRSRDFQDGGGGPGETIDLSTKGRRRRANDGDDTDDADDGTAAVPLIKVPRRRTNSDDDSDQSAPLNLSLPRGCTGSRGPASRDAPASSSFRVICEWDATDNPAATAEKSAATTGDASAGATSAAAAAAARDQGTSQILLLSGKQYEIVPLGDGRWISRNEYELQRGLQKSSSGVEVSGAVRTVADKNVESNGSADQLPSTPGPSTSATTTGETGNIHCVQ